MRKTTANKGTIEYQKEEHNHRELAAALQKGELLQPRDEGGTKQKKKPIPGEDISVAKRTDNSRDNAVNFRPLDQTVAKELVKRAEGLHSELQQSLSKEKKMTPEEEREKMEQAFILKYEDLQHRQDEMESAKRDATGDRFDTNIWNITSILQEQASPKEEMALGDHDTYEKVQMLLNTLTVQKASGDDETFDSPKNLAALKHKLGELRFENDDLRRKVRELTSALKIANIESKSAVEVITERNEEINRLRNTINVLHIQIKNYKARQGNLSQALTASISGPSDEMLRDLEQLRQDYQDLAEINIHLEKENRALRATNEFKPVRDISGTPEAKSDLSPLLDTTSGRRQPKFEIPTSRTMLSLIEQRRSSRRKIEAVEKSAMAALDIDANIKHVPPPPPPVAPVESQPPKRQSLAARQPRLPTATFLPAEVKKEPPPRQPTPTEVQKAPPKSPLAPEVTPPPKREEPEKETTISSEVPKEESAALSQEIYEPQPLVASLPSPAASGAPPEFGKTSVAWNVLRQKVLSAVALSRADVLRREDAHVKRLRQRVSLLSSELTASFGDREALQEKCDDLKQQLDETVTALKTAEGRNEKLAAMLMSRQQGTPESESLRGQQKQPEMRGSQQDTKDEAAGVETLVNIFNDKVQRLEQELAAKNQQVNDLMRMVSTGKGDMTVSMGADDAAPIAVRRLEKEVFKKENALVAREADLKVMQLKLEIAEDQLTEEKAVTNLSIGKKCAARVVPVLRRRLRRARIRLQQRHEDMLNAMKNEEGEEQLDDEADAKSTAFSAGPSGTAFSGSTGTRLRGPQATGRGVVMEEEGDEEVSILRQMLANARNPLFKDLITKMLQSLEMEDINYSSHLGAIAKKDQNYHMLRRLWLRLIILRETAWHEAATEEVKGRHEARLSDTYESFFRFEQFESNDKRPPFAADGALRVVSLASAPISQEGGLKSTDDIEREFSALVELVKTRNSQMLQLESERDELFDRIDKISAHHKATRKAQAPSSAMVVNHRIAEKETTAAICAKYGITNVYMMREIFASAPRSSEVLRTTKFWMPVFTIAALDMVADITDVIFIVRHLVRPNETTQSIAARYSVPLASVCSPCSLQPLRHDERVCVADVLVSRKVMNSLLCEAIHSENPSEQTVISLFAVLPEAPALSTRLIARTYNILDEDVGLFNDVLEPDMDLEVPLLVTGHALLMLDELREAGKVCVEHLVQQGDTIESIAEEYGTTEEQLRQEAPSMKPQTTVRVVVRSEEKIAKMLQENRAGSKKRNSKVVVVAKEGSRTESSYFLPLLPVSSEVVDESPVEYGSLRGKDKFRRRSVAPPAEENETDAVKLQCRVDHESRLSSVACRMKVIREDIEVPNFSLIKASSGCEWHLRLRSFDAVEVARQVGCETHCLVPIRDESIEDLAHAFGISEDALVRANEELPQLGAEGQVFSGHVRIPIINLKVQQEALKRSGELYAIYPITKDDTLDSASKTMGISPSDITLFEATLDPKEIPCVFVRKRRPAQESRVEVETLLPGLSYGKRPPEHTARLKAAIEADIFGIVASTKGDKPGEGVTAVQVQKIDQDDRVIIFVICRGYFTGEAVMKTLTHEGPQSFLEATYSTICALDEKASSDSITMKPLSMQQHHFECPAEEASVIGVRDEDTLMTLALRTGVGITPLYVYNPDLAKAWQGGHPADNTTSSLRGVKELRMKNYRTRSVTVEEGMTIASVAKQTEFSVEAIRSWNLDILPLKPYVASLLIPSVLEKVGTSIVIQNPVAESILSLCTRYRVYLDEIKVEKYDVYVGTDLVVPSQASKTYSNGKVVYEQGLRERRVERGETVESIAADLGIQVDQLVIANPSLIRVKAGSNVTIPVHESQQSALSTLSTGLFIRHPLRPKDTLSSVSHEYCQPVTAVLNANIRLYEISGSHAVFIPVGDDEKDEILSSADLKSVVTILNPGAYGSPASLARKFLVPFEIVSELNKMMPDAKNVIIPLISPVAASIARQKNLPVSIHTVLRPHESLVSLADRYNVFVKDLMIVGQSLQELGVEELIIPLSFDFAKTLLKAPRCEADSLFLRTELEEKETVGTLERQLDMKVELQHKNIADAIVSSDVALEKAREREAAKLSKKSELIDRTVQISHALRQLNERHEATQRELEKVDEIRRKIHEATTKIHQVKVNCDTIGTQTEDKDSDFSRKARKNGAAQTRLTSDSLDEADKQQNERLERIVALEELLEHQRKEALKEQQGMNVKLQTNQRRLVDLGVSVEMKTKEIETLKAEIASLKLAVPPPQEGAETDNMEKQPDDDGEAQEAATEEKEEEGGEERPESAERLDEEREEQPTPPHDDDVKQEEPPTTNDKEGGDEERVRTPQRPPRTKPATPIRRVHVGVETTELVVAQVGTQTDPIATGPAKPPKDVPSPPAKKGAPAPATDKKKEVGKGPSKPTQESTVAASPRSKPPTKSKAAPTVEYKAKIVALQESTRRSAEALTSQVSLTREILSALRMDVIRSFGKMGKEFSDMLHPLTKYKDTSSLEKATKVMKENAQQDAEKRLLESVRVISDKIVPHLNEVFTKARTRRQKSMLPFAHLDDETQRDDRLEPADWVSRRLENIVEDRLLEAQLGVRQPKSRDTASPSDVDIKMSPTEVGERRSSLPQLSTPASQRSTSESAPMPPNRVREVLERDETPVLKQPTPPASSPPPPARPPVDPLANLLGSSNSVEEAPVKQRKKVAVVVKKKEATPAASVDATATEGEMNLPTLDAKDMEKMKVSENSEQEVRRMYNDMQEGIAKIVQDETAEPKPLPEAVTEEVRPVVTVIQKLKTGKMSDEQQEQVSLIRMKDQALRKKIVSATVRSLATQARLRNLLLTISTLQSDEEKQKLEMVAKLWRRWLTNWARRRKQLIEEQRQNIKRILDIFTMMQDEYEQIFEGDGNFNQEKYKSIKDGIMVIRPHRPGSKWMPIEPPAYRDCHSPSSKHFDDAHRKLPGQ